MKLFGNNKKSKHIQKQNPETEITEEVTYDFEDVQIPEETDVSLEETKILPVIKEEEEPVRRRGKKLGTAPKVILIVFMVICLLAVIFAVVYKFWVKPPDVSPDKHPVDENVDSGEEPSGDLEQPDEIDNNTAGEAKREKYTFLVVGTDKVSGGTDTMMVATFDAVNYTLNVVSIPRDTMVNVEYSSNKKINALYNRGGVEELKAGVASILGFEVDFYVAVDLNAFVKLVDAIGGVEFYVPKNMNYDDDVQNLHIHVNKGLQLLDGETALEVMRFRKGYSNADIGRINTQQDFLMTAAEQLLSNVDEIPISTLATIISEDVDTDLSYGNIIWFAKEAIKMDLENIKFNIMPGNYGDSVWLGKGYASYVTIYVDEWLEMVNEFINPFDEEITVEDVDILTRNASGKLYATSGVKKGNENWGSKKGPSGNKNNTVTDDAGSTQTGETVGDTTGTTNDSGAGGDSTQTTDEAA